MPNGKKLYLDPILSEMSLVDQVVAIPLQTLWTVFDQSQPVNQIMMMKNAESLNVEVEMNVDQGYAEL